MFKQFPTITSMFKQFPIPACSLSPACSSSSLSQRVPYHQRAQAVPYYYQRVQAVPYPSVFPITSIFKQFPIITSVFGQCFYDKFLRTPTSKINGCSSSSARRASSCACLRLIQDGAAVAALAAAGAPPLPLPSLPSAA